MPLTLKMYGDMFQKVDIYGMPKTYFKITGQPLLTRKYKSILSGLFLVIRGDNNLNSINVFLVHF